MRHAAPPRHPPTRRQALAGLLAVAMSTLASCSATTPPPAAGGWPLVLSIDDGPMLAPMPLLSPAQRHAALRAALAHERVAAVMFMTLGFGADRPEGLALARQWADAGHRLANHTVSHLDLHDPGVTLARYLAEIDACEAVGRTLPNWRRWFRATYLHAGRDAAERQALRAGLAGRGYQLAEVDLDSEDWRFAAPLQAQLLSTPDAAAPAVQALRARFLQQLAPRADALAQAARHDDPATARPRVLLVHDHLPMALWLPDVLALMRQAGFALVAPERAWPAAVAA